MLMETKLIIHKTIAEIVNGLKIEATGSLSIVIVVACMDMGLNTRILVA